MLDFGLTEVHQVFLGLGETERIETNVARKRTVKNSRTSQERQCLRHFWKRIHRLNNNWLVLGNISHLEGGDSGLRGGGGEGGSRSGKEDE